MKLTVNNLNFSYTNNKILFSNLSFSLIDGDILSILGMNGVGKTTLVKCLLQSNLDYTGCIMIDGKHLSSIPLKERSKIIGYVMLNDIVEKEISVLEYISLGFISQLNFLSSPNENHFKIVYELCKKYNIEYLINRKISTLSQGEGQLVTIMRVLIQNPKIIIFDEPAAALDLKNQIQLINLLHNLSLKGKIIIQISHNPNHAFMLGGKVLLLFKNKYVFGNVNDVMDTKSISELYDTKVEIIEHDNQKFVIPVLNE